MADDSTFAGQRGVCDKHQMHGTFNNAGDFIHDDPAYGACDSTIKISGTSAPNADEEVTVTLTRSEWGVVLAGLRNRRAKARKSAKAVVEKFGDQAVVPEKRNSLIDSAITKIHKEL